MRQLMVWIATFSTVAAMVCFLASEASAAIATQLVDAAHSTTSSTTTTTLHDYAVSGLSTDDALRVNVTFDCSSCTGTPLLQFRNATDNLAITNTWNGTLVTGNVDGMCTADPQTATKLHCNYRVGTTWTNVNTTTTTAYTGNWTLRLQLSGLTGGTLGWTEKVYVDKETGIYWPADANGYLNNNGSGTLTWSTPSSSLPADANGFLYNDGTGTKSWSWLMPPNNCTAVNVNSDEWAPCDPVTSLDVMAFGVIVIAWAIFALAIVWRTRRRS